MASFRLATVKADVWRVRRDCSEVEGQKGWSTYAACAQVTDGGVNTHLHLDLHLANCVRERQSKTQVTHKLKINQYNNR